MKHLFIALFFFLILCPAFGQNNIVKTAGVSYTAGAPTFTPGRTGSQVAIDTVTGLWYEHNGTSWSASGYRVQTISGCSAPAYTPAKYQSRLVINACSAGQGGPELYYYTGSAWLQINEGQIYTAGTGIAISGGNVISSTVTGGVDSTFSLLDGTYPNRRITSNVERTGKVLIGSTTNTDTLGVITAVKNSTEATPVFVAKAKTNGNVVQSLHAFYINSKELNNLNRGFGLSYRYNKTGNGQDNFGLTGDTTPLQSFNLGYNFGYVGNSEESSGLLGYYAMFDQWENYFYQGMYRARTGTNRGSEKLDTVPAFERHWTFLDSAGNQLRPLNFVGSKNGLHGDIRVAANYFTVTGYNLGQNTVFAINRNSEFIPGTMNVFNDSLRTVDLANIKYTTAAHFSSANKAGAGDPTNRGTFITIGGNGSFNNVVGIGAKYVNSNNAGDLDMIFTTQNGVGSGTQSQKMVLKGGALPLLGIGQTSPLQTLDVGGASLLRGSARINMVGDSAALYLKYASTQTTPIFKIQNNAGADLAYIHVFNPSSNPSFIVGKSGSIDATSPNNVVVGLSTAIMAPGAGNNTLIGTNVANALNGGYENTMIGAAAGQASTTAFQNTFIGYLAGQNNTTGFQNVLIGRRSGFANITGQNNVSIGTNAMSVGTAVVANVAIGPESLRQNNSDSNTGVGYGAGRLATGSANVFIGYGAGAQQTSGNAKLYIDNSNTLTPLIGGDFANNSVGINTAPGSIAVSAALEITSTNQGFLPPRMTQAQRDAISSPAAGLTVYCTDCTAFDLSTGVMVTWNGATWKTNW